MAAPDATIDLAMATLCCDGFGDEDFRYAFETMPSLGITNVEFNCWYPRNLTPAGIDSIRRRCEDSGLRPVSLHVPGYSAASRSELTRETARWIWLLEACQRLDVRLLKATGSARGTGGGLDGIIDVLSVIAPIAADHGVTLALENHFQNVLEFADDYEQIFSAVPHENVGLCLDTGHFAASDVDMLDVVRRLGSRIVHVDLKDCAAGGAENFVPFGEGTVNFAAVLDAVVDTGYSGFLLVEFPRRNLDVMTTDLRRGIVIAEPYLRAASATEEED